MRTLRNHLILYDAECPMCQLYTRAFTKTGMLDPSGRAPYQTTLDQKNQPLICPLIDRQRAVNEIALINTLTGEVQYGIDSLFKIIGHSCPLFRPLFNNRSFTWLLRKTYAFISYNRKVIIPPHALPADLPAALPPDLLADLPAEALAKADASAKEGPSVPQPSFNIKYRLAYLLFTITIAAAILTRYAHLLTAILPAGSRWREYLICSGQVLYQGMVVTIFAPAKRWDYLGNMMTISLAGSIALLPAIVIAAHLSPIAAAIWFLIVAGLMLLEHIRRTRLLGLDWTITISWIAYRLVILLLILH